MASILFLWWQKELLTRAAEQGQLGPVSRRPGSREKRELVGEEGVDRVEAVSAW